MNKKRKQAKNIYIVKECYDWLQSSVSLSSQKTPLIISKAVYTRFDEWISYIIRTSALCYLWWENSRESWIQSASACSEQENSSERLWLAIAFISSTDSCVIGYNAQHLKRVKKIMEQHWADLSLMLRSTHFILILFATAIMDLV